MINNLQVGDTTPVKYTCSLTKQKTKQNCYAKLTVSSFSKCFFFFFKADILINSKITVLLIILMKAALMWIVWSTFMLSVTPVVSCQKGIFEQFVQL